MACQFSVYPLGEPDYMEVIYDVIAQTKAHRAYSGSQHFCTRLEGPIDAVFEALASAFSLASGAAAHTVMTATLSVNSPSRT